MEYVLMAILLVAAIFIIVAVIFQKSADEGLSGTIAGGNESFYGREKAAHGEKKLYKWTLIACVVFALAVLVAYVIQPDYTYSLGAGYWKDKTEFSSLFK